MMEAKCTVIGGHSVRNEDVLFGYAVTGLIDPKRIWKNVGARIGDALLFTKPLGTGVISTALKSGKAPVAAVSSAIHSMSTLNRATADALHEIEAQVKFEHAIHAVTDVTGFGLLGHAREMALGNPEKGIEMVSFELDHAQFSYLPAAFEAAEDGFLPGGLNNNREFVGDCAEFAPSVPQQYRDLLFDPQTSGGLLISIAAEAAGQALIALQRHGVNGNQVGRVGQKRSPMIYVS
jgi:selenide,water dikinase